jgi:hypothetical protein
VDRVRPVVDGGHRSAKAAMGQRLTVEADAFVDGHDLVACELRFRHAADTKWTVIPMHDLGDDRWGRSGWSNPAVGTDSPCEPPSIPSPPGAGISKFDSRRSKM